MQSRYPLLKKWTAEEHERLKALADTAGIALVTLAQLNAGDYVEVSVWQNSGGTRVIDGTTYSNLPAFWMTRIGT